MCDIYRFCPPLDGPGLTLRFIAMEDAEALLQVYGDRENVPSFNSDNCTGDFYMPLLEDMRRCLDFWLKSYAWKQFVRWSIVEKGCVIGTVECFYRGPSDALGDSALLRIDLRRDRDTLEVNGEILDLLLPRLKSYFGGRMTAIKAPACVPGRIAALRARGFIRSEEPLIGHAGTQYFDYWTRPH